MRKKKQQQPDPPQADPQQPDPPQADPRQMTLPDPPQVDPPQPAADPPRPGMTGLSSGEFDAQTANVPAVIDGSESEVIPPAAAAAAASVLEQGWPVWDVQQLLTLPFFFLARRYGDLWQIEDDEAQYLAKVWKPILDRYLPLGDTEFGTALLCSIAIIGPRAIQTDWSKAPKKPAAAAGANSTRPGNTKTGASGVSPATSEKESQENLQSWEVFSKQ